MSEQDTATQHPDLDEDLAPVGLGKSPLAQRLKAQFLPPLPEESWASPKQRPPADELDSAVTTTSDRSDPAVDSLYDPSGKAGSTGSTDLAQFRKGTAKVYGEVISALAAMLAGLANWRAADDEQDPTWLMDEDEAHAIGDPLGRIAARRATLPLGGEETTDIMDGLQAGIAVIGYLGKNMMRRADRRRPQPAPMPQDQAA